MKLSEYIRYRNQIEALDSMAGNHAADLEISKITNIVEICPIEFTSELVEIQKQKQNVYTAFENITLELEKLKRKVNNEISAQGQIWLQESEQRYEVELKHKSVQNILDRKTSIPQSDFEYFVARLSTYAAWKYPGLILRPAQHGMIYGMVCFDPLYIVDTNLDLLWPCQLEFPDQYRRRLRPLVIEETDDDSLTMIPDNQMGIVLCYDYFNFLPLSVVVKLLSQIFQKLRPGGTLCMTFNDCDTEPGMKLVESYYTTYIPQRVLMTHIDDIGFKLFHCYNNQSPMTWLELRKPGQLESTRGGQVLAQVRPKPQQK
jgi:ribosome-associated translation inhibitor RaiA